MAQTLLTLEKWREDPASVINSLFARSGLVATALGTRYFDNPEQTRFARIAAETIRRGATAPSITPVQAGTGTGKTLGYLIPAFIEASLTGDRVRVATNTLVLQRQLVATEGPVAADIVATLTGKPALKIAATHARTQFACPTKLKRYMEALRDEGMHEDARVLSGLFIFAEQAIDMARAIEAKDDERGQTEFVQDGHGLIETWIGDDPMYRRVIDDIPRQSISIDADSIIEDQAPWRMHRSRATDAQCSITTHASLLIDMQQYGGISNAIGNPFAVTIIDEADRLDDAASNVFSTRISLRSLAMSLRDLLPIIASNDISPSDERTNCATDIGVIAANLDELCDTIATAVSGRDAVLRADHPFVPHLRAIHDRIPQVMKDFDAIATKEDHDLRRRIIRSTQSIGLILKTIDTPVDKRFGKPAIDLSPIRLDPSLSIVPQRGARLVSRLWTLDRAMSRSVIFTSATLAVPTATAMTMHDFLHMVGLRPSDEVLNADLMEIIEPKKFGNPTFVFASPLNAIPNRDGENARTAQSEEWLNDIAVSIQAAADQPTAKGSCRILVLTTSFSDTKQLNERLEETLHNRLIVRDSGEPLIAALAQYRADPAAILITPGAMEGVDLPGMVDHLIIPRAPFAPPRPDNRRASAVFNWMEDDVMHVSQATARVLRLMRQAIGRGIRQASDAPKIWMLDPRFGLPAKIQRDLMAKGILPHPKAHQEFLMCIPDRFRIAVQNAELFEGPSAKANSEPVKKTRATRKKA